MNQALALEKPCPVVCLTGNEIGTIDNISGLEAWLHEIRFLPQPQQVFLTRTPPGATNLAIPHGEPVAQIGTGRFNVSHATVAIVRVNGKIVVTPAVFLSPDKPAPVPRTAQALQFQPTPA